MKRIAVICACLMIGWAGVFAQEVTTYGSENAKVTFFNELTGYDLVGISDDGRFFYGSAQGGSSFIYEVAKDSISYKDGGDFLRVKDWNNYVAARYTLLNGERHTLPAGLRNTHIELGVDAASADLKTLFAGYYDPGKTPEGQSSYSTLRINAETGELIDTLPWVYPIMQMPGYINKAVWTSNDGKVVVGMSSSPNGLYNTNPAFWDLEAGTRYDVGFTGAPDGELIGCNNDGTVLCGAIGDGNRTRAYLIDYDKSAGSSTRVEVPLWATSTTSSAYAVSETGIVVGAEEGRTFVYDRNSGEKYEMADYLRYLYGVNLPENVAFNTTSHISDNGRVFVGTSDPYSPVPYLIELGEHQIPAVARSVSARQTRGTDEVTVIWSKPLMGEYTLKGYWVYRDSVRMNNTMLAADALSFSDQKVPAGSHTYAVQAVYENQHQNEVVAEYTFAAPIRVTAVGECLPVQEIYSNTLYNRFVTLYWNLPSDKATAPAAAKKPAAKGYQAQSLDVVDVFDVKNTNASSAVRVGNYVYAVAFQSDLVRIFNAETGVLEKVVAVNNFNGAYDLTAHEYTIYAVSNDNVVRPLEIDPDDPFKVELGSFWTAKTGSKLTHIAYVENDDNTFNNGQDYLILGNYNNVMFYPVVPLNANDTLRGSEKFNLRAYSIGGSEVHDGKLYVANQSSLTHSEVDVFDLATGKHLFSENLAVLPQVSTMVGSEGMYVAGIAKSKLDDGMVVLQCMAQPLSPNATTNYLVNMELESWPETNGYNVYRDGEKVNDGIIKGRRFTDTLYNDGTYEYTVEYVAAACNSFSSSAGVSEEVKIDPIGTCEKPRELKAVEANNQVVLTWTRPTEARAWVGYNIYRDGEQKEALLRNDSWLDLDKLQKDNKYTYVVEAFYNNSCVASDTISIIPTFEGTAMPPSNPSYSVSKGTGNTYDVELSWDLPYFEEPMAYGYCGAPVGDFTPGGSSTIFALIGWDAASRPFFEDMYLVGMEYIVGTEELISLDGVVYIDNQMRHTEPVARWKKDEWNTLYFSKPFSMNYNTEIAVGYIASWNVEELSSNVLVYDAGPGKRAFSDILSFDGKTSTTLAAAGIDANLCINALIVRSRDLEAAASAPDPAAYLKDKMIKTNMPWKVASSSVLTDAPKTSSNGIKLQGFNVYDENDAKLNDTLLTGFKFQQNGLQGDRDYAYAIGAQYEGADEQFADLFVYFTETDIEKAEVYGLRVYPNPVGENLNIEGEYRTLFLTDLAGKRVGNVMQNTGTVSMTALQSGVYLLHFTMLDGKNLVMKVVKR